jgi:hypothetical protein
MVWLGLPKNPAPSTDYMPTLISRWKCGKIKLKTGNISSPVLGFNGQFPKKYYNFR